MLRASIVVGLFSLALYAGLSSFLHIDGAATPSEASYQSDADFRAALAQVNRAFQRRWESLGVQPASRADDLAIVRRLSLGLMGTIPSLQEIRQFESLPTQGRVSRWLEKALADRRSADYLAERLARAYVGTEDGPFLLFRRRRFVAWLSDEFAQNRPYDELVRALIVSRGLWTDHPATNFLTVTLENERKHPNAERLAARVTRAFLGLRLDCAQCHNHPFAAWKRNDFLGLAAFFGQTQIGIAGLGDGVGEFEVEDRKTNRKEAIAPRVPFAPELLPDEGTRRERLAAWVTNKSNPYFAPAIVNRIWALLCGLPLLDPVDNLEADSAHNEPLQILARDFADHGFDLRRLVHLIAATDVFQLASAAEPAAGDDAEKAWAIFPLTRLRPEQVVGSLLQAASLETIDADSHILVRIARSLQQGEFVKHYGDTDEDEFAGRGGTIPQRLVLMNGNLVHDKLKDSLFNAATQIARWAPDDRTAIESTYLCVLTRLPTDAELTHFESALKGNRGPERVQVVEDLAWALINSTEFAWNH